MGFPVGVASIRKKLSVEYFGGWGSGTCRAICEIYICISVTSGMICWTIYVNSPDSRRGCISSTILVISPLLYNWRTTRIVLWIIVWGDSLLCQTGRRICPLRWLQWLSVLLVSGIPVWKTLTRFILHISLLLWHMVGIDVLRRVFILSHGRIMPPLSLVCHSVEGI